MRPLCPGEGKELTQGITARRWRKRGLHLAGKMGVSELAFGWFASLSQQPRTEGGTNKPPSFQDWELVYIEV